MISKAPVPASMLHGLKTCLPVCSRTGRLQPCLPLALAHTFGFSSGPSLSYSCVRKASKTTKLLRGTRLTRLESDRSLAVSNSFAKSFAARVNPPLSTLPAPLEFPERQPDQAAAKYWWNVGKAFWAFYKQGVKNIYANRKAAKDVRARLLHLRSTEHYDGRVLERPRSDNQTQPTDGTGGSPAGITRSDFLLERRSRAEMRRVPIFAVILALFGEWTPLLVMFATPIVPYNCRIPRQIRKSREKQEARRSNSFRGDYNRSTGVNPDQPYIPTPSDAIISESRSGLAEGGAMLHMCRSLNLFPSWIDLPLLIPGVRVLWLRFIVRPQTLLDNRCTYLSNDDTLLLRAGNGIAPADVPSRLRDEEVLIAAEERGIDVLGRKLDDVRHDLGLWLDIFERSNLRGLRDGRSATALQKQNAVYQMLLTRPNQWEDIRQQFPQESPKM